MKKILLGLGTLAAAVAPVTAVVACGSSNGSGFGDGTKNETDGGKAVTHALQSHTTDATTQKAIADYGNYKLTKGIFTELLINNNKYGLAKNITLADFYNNSASENTAKEKEFLAPLKKINAKEIIITKKQIASDAKKGTEEDIFSSKFDEIKALTDSTKNYVLNVTQTQGDNSKNEGSWKIDIYENNVVATDLVQKAADEFTNHYEFDPAMILKGGGAYLFSSHHQYKGSGNWGIYSDDASKESRGFSLLGDREKTGGFSNDNLFTYTALKPTADADHTILDKIVVDGKFMIDQKTDKPTLVLKVYDDLSKKSKSIFIDASDIVNNISKEKFNLDEFKKIWVNDFNFVPMYKEINTLKDELDELGGKGFNGIAKRLIEVLSKLNLVAQSYRFSNTTDFIEKFDNYLTKDTSFNKDAMFAALKSFKVSDINSNIAVLAGKTFSMFYWVDKLYGKFEDFIIDNKIKTDNEPTWKLSSISGLAAIDKIIIDEKAKATRVEAAKEFLDGHTPKVPYNSLKTDDDILKLASDTKATDYASAIKALAADVATEKAKLNGLSDDKTTHWIHDGFSLKSKELLKFLDLKWKLVFGDKLDTSSITKQLSKASSIGSFDSLNNEYVGSGKIFSDPTAQNLVTTILSKMQKADADKLTAAIFAPLGFVA